MGNCRQWKLTKKCFMIPFTPFAVNPSFSAVFIIPKALVPCLSVPAASRILVIDMPSPYCLDMIAKHAAAQSVTSCCFIHIYFIKGLFISYRTPNHIYYNPYISMGYSIHIFLCLLLYLKK